MSADGKGDPPPELELAWLCGDYFLPDGGALLEQDYKQLKTMKSLRNVYRTVQKMRGLTGESINTGLSVSDRMLLGSLREMGIKIGMGG